MSTSALLLSAYDAQSHRYWRRQISQGLGDISWTELALPPRYFAWRQRGNSLSWAFNYRDCLEQPYDFLLATSMVDLSALRGFVPALAGIPNIVYFHENQFAYPQSHQQHPSIEPQLTSVYTALCADGLLFNSPYNLQSFIAGAKALLKAMPDQVPKGLIDQLLSKAKVLPVPIAPVNTALMSKAPVSRPAPELHIVWNHRWEYDKGPKRLLALFQCLDKKLRDAKSPQRILWSVVGQSFRQSPSEFDQIKHLCEASDSPQRILNWGYLASEDAYDQLLVDADVVLSTAEHDFQGLAVLEAQARGCYPLVPKRVVYPCWFGAEHCYPSLDLQAEAEALAQRVLSLSAEKLRHGSLAPVRLSQDFQWTQLGDEYRSYFQGFWSDKC